jgi:DNA primase
MIYSTNDVSLFICRALGIDTKGQRTGNIMVHCIFGHEDKTPSLSISLDKGLYNAFCCGKSGKLTALYWERFGKSAYREMGVERADVMDSVPSMSYIEANYDEPPFVSFKFDGSLVPAESHVKGKEFLSKRGFSSQISKSMGMKFALSGVSKNANFPNDKSEWVWFSHRVIIPIYERNKLISIEGRAVETKQEWEETMRSLQLDPSARTFKKVIFPKGSSTSTLFQWEILDKDEPLYIVEGLMDLAALRSSSTTRNSTAYFGASIGARQLYLLSKFSQIVIIPDHDAAGLGTLRRLKKTELAPRMTVVFPPAGCKDVNDVLMGKCPGASSLDEAISKNWLHSAVELEEFDIDAHEAAMRKGGVR